jgi:8-oxo-dGTP pyrophosphatase MutT (NUDIX family)
MHSGAVSGDAGEVMLHKVAAFVTPGVGARQALLVIEHPNAGIQLPAGTVEVGEAPETAVLRELREEAGLSEVTLVQKLAEFSQLTGDQRVMCQTVRLQAGPEPDAPWLEYSFRRGWYVREVGRQNGRVHICYEEHAYEGNTPGEVVLSWDGWVGETAVTQHLIRHLYHLRPTRELPDEWYADPGDHGHPPWRLFWQPLATAELVQGQQEWLERVRGRVRMRNEKGERGGVLISHFSLLTSPLYFTH